MFITFEGIDGCGKSTQISQFEEVLRQRGISPVVTKEPGGTKIGQAVRNILLSSGNNELVPLAELFLYLADRAQHVREVINPALEAGRWVICDRYYDATTVYQGVVLEHGGELIELLNREATSGLEPDITFLLDCPAEVGVERRAKRYRGDARKDRFERRTLDFHVKIRYAYLALASRYRERFRIIDATLPEDQVARKIRETMAPYLPNNGQAGGE